MPKCLGFFIFSFCNSKEPDQTHEMSRLLSGPSPPPFLPSALQPCQTAMDQLEQVSAEMYQGFAWVSQSKWQDLFYHAELSPVSRAAGRNFLLWRPPFCCCVTKGFCRLLYCLNSHQILHHYSDLEKKTQNHKANSKTKISSLRPHQGLLILMCFEMFCF